MKKFYAQCLKMECVKFDITDAQLFISFFQMVVGDEKHQNKQIN